MRNYAVNIIAGIIFLGTVLVVMGINLAWLYVVVRVIMYALGMGQ